MLSFPESFLALASIAMSYQNVFNLFMLPLAIAVWIIYIIDNKEFLIVLKNVSRRAVSSVLVNMTHSYLFQPCFCITESHGK